jgi:hypothetical protein
MARAKNRAAEGLTKLTVDSPIPYTLTDLTNAIQNEMGLLNKATDTAPYMRLKTKIDELKADPRYSFMFSGMLVADSMTTFISKIFRLPAKGKPISIVDVSGVPSDITSVVVAVLSRLVFDYAIWSRNELQRPVLLVCEEAHRYVPADKTSSGQAVRKILERIAKEGRKYGVSLGLITQRPSDLAEGVLSQCGTIIAMRLNNERDQHFVKARCRKARAASSTSSRRCATANASSAARASRSRSASPSTISSATAARPRPIRSSPSCGSRAATRKRWSPASSSAGAPGPLEVVLRGGSRRTGRLRLSRRRLFFGLARGEARLGSGGGRPDGHRPRPGEREQAPGAGAEGGEVAPLSCERITNFTDAGLIGTPLR